MTTFRPSENMRDTDSQHTANQPNNPTSYLQAAIIHEQLTTLAELIGDARAELETLHQEVADLSTRLQQSQARIDTLAALLLAHEKLLTVVRASIVTMPTEAATQTPPQLQPASESSAANGNAKPVTSSGKEATSPAPEQPAPRPSVPSPQPARSAAPAVQPVAQQMQQQTQPSAKPARSGELGAEPPPAASAPPLPSQPVTTRPSVAETPQIAPAPPPPTPTPIHAQEHPSSASEPGPHESGKTVQRGSMVEVVFNDDTDEETEIYTIVSSDEANPARNLIGETSPLGSALIGAHPGDVRRFRVGGTGPERTVRICTII